MTEKAFLIHGQGSFIQNDVYIVDIDFVVVCLLKLHVKCSTVAGVTFYSREKVRRKNNGEILPHSRMSNEFRKRQRFDGGMHKHSSSQLWEELYFCFLM